MNLRNKYLILILIPVLIISFPVWAKKPELNGRVNAEIQPFIESVSSGVFINAPLNGSMSVMIVRVFNQSNELVIEMRSLGEPVEILASALVDGRYHYQIKTLLSLTEPIGEGADQENVAVDLQSGSFQVKSNQIIPRTDKYLSDRSATIGVADSVYRLLGMLIGTIVPSASAANVTASGSNPALILDDTAGLGFDGYDWRVSSSFGGDFAITDELNGRTPFRIESGQINVDTGNAIIVKSWGDVKIQGLTLVKSSGRAVLDGTLSIGTSTASADLTIYDSTPDIRLHNEIMYCRSRI